MFNKKGYAGTSLSDLTTATGLTKGSIYGNFENKEEVALAVFDYNCELISKTITQQLPQAKSGSDRLMIYAQVYRELFDLAEVNDWGGCPILNTATEADDTNEHLRTKAATAVLEWRNSLMEIIELGVANQEFKPETNSQQMALAIVALIEGGIMIAKVTHDFANMDSILTTVRLLINQMEK